MKIEETKLQGVKILTPDVWRDDRGLFVELCRANRYEEWLGVRFVQDNFSVSQYGTLRGLHFQYSHPQGKLVTVTSGKIFDVVVDLREESETFGQWTGVILDSESMQQLFIPEGFAHGFVTLSETAHVLYRCTDYYHPQSEATLQFDDPTVGVVWPQTEKRLLSPKDQAGRSWQACLALLQNIKEEKY